MIKSRECISVLKPYVPGKPIDDVKKEYNIETVYKLASNENPNGCSSNIKDAIIKSCENPSLYPDGNCTVLRKEVAEFYGVNGSQLIFGTGTDEIISLISKVFVNVGDECITADTTFGQYKSSVLQMNGKIIETKMKNNGFDLDAILQEINDKTKLIFIANPNNPTGTIFREKEQLAFMEKVPSNILVIFDEAYSEFVFDKEFPNTIQLLKKYKNAMLFKTFSKAYGLASFRVGYAIGDSEIITEMEKARNPFNVSTQAQVAATQAILDQDFVKFTAKTNKETLDYLTDELNKRKIEYIPSFANFIMIDVKKDSKIIFEELMKLGVIIRGGYVFNMNTYLRVSIGKKEEMEVFLQMLDIVLK